MIRAWLDISLRIELVIEESKPLPGVRTRASTSRSCGGDSKRLDEANASASFSALLCTREGRFADCASIRSGATMLRRRVRWGREVGASRPCADFGGMVENRDDVYAVEAMNL